jgi:hypothetical protein
MISDRSAYVDLAGSQNCWPAKLLVREFFTQVISNFTTTTSIEEEKICWQIRSGNFRGLQSRYETAGLAITPNPL